MASWTAEEVVEGLELWLKEIRQDFERDSDPIAGACEHLVDSLLDEVRDSAAEGWMVWQDEAPGRRERLG